MRMKKIAKKIVKMNVVLLYCITLSFYLLWTHPTMCVLDKIGADFSQNVAGLGSFIDADAVITCVLLPFAEEILCRWLPFLFIISVFAIIKFGLKKRNRSLLAVKRVEVVAILVFVVLTSIIYGYLHGSAYNILIQGILGVILSMYYLRAYYRRVLAGKKCYIQIIPLFASTMYHIVNNSLIFLVIPTLTN